jgi:23S rRNA (adenine2030-N6)-methyltransferase
MLSYRHAYHAGNHGDVLKHTILVLCAEYLQRKENPFVYIDTHAGAGLYDLQSQWSQKNREFQWGILPLWGQNDLPPELRTYIDMVQRMNLASELRWYPGSPWLFRQLMRKQDKARLYELHSSEFLNLQNLFAHEQNVKIENADGLQSLKSVLPPLERRALVLIDPSYEVKSDFVLVIKALKESYRRFASGVYLLWYPVLQQSYTAQLERGLRDSGIRDILLVELIVAMGPGMTGSGMIVVNPPWLLKNQLGSVLPYLAKRLGNENTAKFRIETLAEE